MEDEIVQHARHERRDLRAERGVRHEIVRGREPEKDAGVLVARRVPDPVHGLAVVRARIHPVVPLVGGDLVEIRRILWHPRAREDVRVERARDVDERLHAIQRIAHGVERVG